jgi:SAM-dependent methyltransferase
MHDALYRQLGEVEDRHWWHRARAQLVRTTLRKFHFDPDSAALDVGCGTGGMLTLLSEFSSRVVGLDRSPTALELAGRKLPGAELHGADANALAREFAPDSFDLVTLFNVLYHEWIDSESDVLRQVCRILKPGGLILITEAAFPSLTRRHDRLAMGARRYTLRRMQDLLIGAGLEWRDGTYFNLTSFLPAWILARWQRRCRAEHDQSLAELRLPPKWLDAVMNSAMCVERFAIQMAGRLPLGVSLLCTATRPAARRPTSRTIVHPASEQIIAPGC